jgi:Ca2+-binding RTX toxin-like protein
MALISGTANKKDLLLNINGNDTLTGGSGVDTAQFNGKLSDYNFTVAHDDTPGGIGNYLLISDANGSDEVKADIEILRFLDASSATPKIKLLSVTQEVVANGFTEGDQTTSNLIALSDGSFINFWLSPDGYYFRKFNADGTSNSQETKILDQVKDELSSDVTAAVLNDGSFVLAWVGKDASGTGVFAQRFDTNGKYLEAKFRINDTITQDQNKPVITALSDGGYVIAWQSKNQGDSIQNGSSMGGMGGDSGSPNSTGVFAQIFDSGSNPVGWEIDVSKSSGIDPFVTALTGGQFIIGYEAIAGGITRMTAYASIYDGQGNSITTLHDSAVPHNDIADGGAYDGYDAYDDLIVTGLNGSASIDQINYSMEPFIPVGNVLDDAGRIINNLLRKIPKIPVAATLENNNAVVVWQAPIDPYLLAGVSPPTVGYDFSIMLRLYDSITGLALTQEIKANTFTTYDQSEPAVAPLSGGGFVVIWQSQLQDESYNGIYGQRFDSSGVKVGSEFQISTKVADSQKDPTVVGLKDGGFVVSWVAEFQDGNQQGKYQNGLSGTEIVMQRFDSNGNKLGLAVAGGSADDIIAIGGTDSIGMDGAAGKDTLTSGSGIDTLRGGDGDDLLDGGEGNDFLSGGNGDDTILAGSGNDTIDGGSGSDTLLLTGSNKDYEIEQVGNATIVTPLTSGEGIDTLLNIESLKYTIVIANEPDISSLSSSGSKNAVPGVNLSDDDLTKATVLDGTPNGDTLAGGNTKGIKADVLQGGAGDDRYIAKGEALVIYDTASVDTLKTDPATTLSSQALAKLGGVDTLQTGFADINLSAPLKNTIKGLRYIENVELDGTKPLKLIGSAVDNALSGNVANNVINGAAGNDIIWGNVGNDTLTGGAGNDVFIFRETPNPKINTDIITDFVHGTDKIRLSTAIFKDIDPDKDGVINFISDAGLTSSEINTASFIVYDWNTGSLYYDASDYDATGAEKVTNAILFAKLSASSSSKVGSHVVTGAARAVTVGAAGGTGGGATSDSTSSSSGGSSTSTTVVGSKHFPDLQVTDFDLFL